MIRLKPAPHAYLPNRGCERRCVRRLAPAARYGGRPPVFRIASVTLWFLLGIGWPAWVPPSEAQWRADDGLVLIGTAVTLNDQDEVIPNARLFIRNGTIRAIIRPGQPLPPDASRAIVVETNGFIYPGLIDLHNHPEYNVFPLWVVPERYQDRYQWRARKAYKVAVAEPYKLLSAKKYLNLQAELGKYAELKALVGGTTAIQGMARHKAYSSEEYLVRNVEYTDVGARPVRRLLDPPRSENAWAEARQAASTAGAWLFHLAEGISPRARAEFGLLRSKGLLLPQLVGIHSVGLRPEEFQTLGARGSKMVWSPLSNYLLYGETADVRAAKGARVLISLAPDWSPSGSKSVLGELKVADLLNSTRLNHLFSDRELVHMITRNPARALGWGEVAGQLAPRFLGDVIIVDKLHDDPYHSLILATETHVQLVTVRGEPLYGDEAIMRRLKTYEASVNGSTQPVPRFERLDGPRPKAVDFQHPGLEKGSLPARELIEQLREAMRFDDEYLYRRIPPQQVQKDLATCPGKPSSTSARSKPEFKRFLQCKFHGGPPAIPLDPLFTATDEAFFRRLDANKNLPPELKRLKEYYRSP